MPQLMKKSPHPSEEALAMAKSMRASRGKSAAHRQDTKQKAPFYVEGGFINDRSGAATRALRKRGYHN